MLPTVASRSSAKKRFPSGSPSRTAEDAKMWMEWKKQLTAYVAWVNSQLKKKLGAHLVEDLRHDVRDGVALINLIEVIAGEQLPNTHPAPSTTAEMVENVEAVLQFMAINKIKMHHITTRDVVDGNLKAIMRLVLALAAHYKPNSVRHSTQQQQQASHSITGIAQGAAAALTEARRTATRAGHRHRRRRQREEPRESDPQGSDSDAPPPPPSSQQSSISSHRKSASMSRISQNSQHQHQHHHHHPLPARQHRHSYSSSLRVVGEGGEECRGDRAQLDGASASSSPTSSRGTSPRTSLYLSDPPSSMEGLLYSTMNHKGGLMMTSCESDTLGDSGFSDICDNLKDTHQMLFRLQDLLLNGEGVDASGASPGEMEGSNPHETISLLRSRLLHSEEVSGSLRTELAKVKKDCLELQGAKAGLHQRLTQQEAELAEVKAALATLELQHSKQLSELESVRHALGEREQTLTDVRASCLKQAQDRDTSLAQLRGELLARDLQLAQLRDRDSLASKSGVNNLAKPEVNCGDRKMTLLSDYLEYASTEVIGEQQLSDLEVVNQHLQNARCQLTIAQEAAVSQHQQGTPAAPPAVDTAVGEGCAALDCLEDSLVQVLHGLHLTAGGGVQAALLRSEAQKGVAPTSSPASQRGKQKTPGRQLNNSSHTRRYTTGTVAEPKSRNGQSVGVAPSRIGRGQGFGSGRGSPSRMQPVTPGVSKQGPQVSPRPSAATHSMNRVPRPKSYSGAPASEGHTTVNYYVAQSDKPLTCVIHKKLGEIRLRDFKSAVGESNLYHYYFKAYDPAYGTVKEEVFHDDDVLPGYEGKIFAWLQEEGGTNV